MFLLNTFLGFLLAQLWDILNRQKHSPTSPRAFSLYFFFADSWLKITVSLLLSFTISLITHLNWDSILAILGADFVLNSLVYVVIGAAPEFILQQFKKRWGVLQPPKVGGYNRKS